MQSQDKYRIALLSAYAIGLHSIESLIPSPVPWLRLGFANIITVITLLLYGMKPAIMVTLIRVLVSSLLTGTFLGPAFILSFGGGIASAVAMALVFSVAPGFFSIIGISIVGALFHNITQLFFAYLLFVPRIGVILMIAPFILLLGTLTGLVNGVVSDMIIKNLKKNNQKSENVSK